ncbi:hypothetical protein [Novosphingobium resinovorum]|uniref:hypothetical protein n=1 Tax=Novosphingobium resinovorum TaxID=158500 RepID=UPI002ED6610E|nr:hypothetical protein [Novosphingobium resinovorum]
MFPAVASETSHGSSFLPQEIRNFHNKTCNKNFRAQGLLSFGAKLDLAESFAQTGYRRDHGRSRATPDHWLALRVPALYPDAEWATPTALLNKRKIFAIAAHSAVRANRALKACSKFSDDVLVVEFEHDEHVPHPAIALFIAAFRQANSLSYRVIRGADHAPQDKTCRKAYNGLLIAWVGEIVRGARHSATMS